MFEPVSITTTTRSATEPRQSPRLASSFLTNMQRETLALPATAVSPLGTDAWQEEGTGSADAQKLDEVAGSHEPRQSFLCQESLFLGGSTTQNRIDYVLCVGKGSML